MDAKRSVAELLFALARRQGARPLLHWKADGRWRHWSATAAAHATANVAARLVALGLRPGARVALLSENRPEWLLADLACLAAGLVDVPLYATAPPAEQIELLARSRAELLFVASPAQWRTIAASRAALPALRHGVAFDHGDSDDPALLSFATLAADADFTGADAAAAEVKRRLAATQRSDVATVLYTSGTSGEPKGVQLTHDNLLSNCAAILQHVALGPDDLTLSFLPLSHSFERTAGHYALLAAGGAIAYASSLDAVAQEVREVRPTLLLGVPRFYEKVHDRILGTLERAPRYRRALFEFAQRVADETAAFHQQAGAAASLPLKLRFRHELAERLVRSLMRQRFGGRLRFLVSGGAPLDPELVRFFEQLGLPLLEGYGLTECAPVVAVNRVGRARAGTVGEPLPGVEVSFAEDGEILVRGRNVMSGYLDDPAATAAAFTADGRLKTGDLGALDGDGYLRVTGRKKDLIIGSGGKNIAPARIEEQLKRQRIVADCCLIGDRRPFLVALLVPDEAALKTVLAEQGIEWSGRAEMLERPEVRALFDAAVARVNEGLAPPERVRRFALLPEPFSAETRELTPTLKVRRAAVARRWAAAIEALYALPHRPL